VSPAALAVPDKARAAFAADRSAANFTDIVPVRPGRSAVPPRTPRRTQA